MVNQNMFAKTTLVAVIALVLSACGNNPFKRTSNPVSAQDYPALTKARAEKRLKPYDGKAVVDPELPDNTQRVCYDPFEVRVSSVAGYKLLPFVEGQEASYKIEVQSRIAGKFTVSTPKLKNSSFDRVSFNENTSTAVYEFKWKPAKKSHGGEVTENLQLNFNSAKVEQICGDETQVSDTINLLVTKAAIEIPNVEIADAGQGACYEPFQVTISNDLGNRMMAFTESTHGAYTVQVRNLMNDTFSTHPILPSQSNSTWTPVSQDGTTATYRFTYQPDKFSSVKNPLQFLKLNFHSAKASQACGPQQALINLFVKKSASLPRVSFVNLPTSTLSSPARAQFQVQVIDSASTAELGPEITEIIYPKSTSTGERLAYDASQAVKCDSFKYVEDTRWIANCEFDSNLVKNTAGLDKSGKVMDASFAINAISGRSRINSGSTAARIRVQFEKPPEVAPATPESKLNQEAAAKAKTSVDMASKKKTTKTTKKASKGAKS